MYRGCELSGEGDWQDEVIYTHLSIVLPCYDYTSHKALQTGAMQDSHIHTTIPMHDTHVCVCVTQELEFYTSAAPTPSRSQQLPDTTQPNTDTPTPTPTPQPTNTATTITPATTAIQPSSEPQKAPLIDLLSDDIPMTTATHIQQGVSTSTAANGSTAHTAETDLAATGLQAQANGSDKAAAPATAAGVPVQTTGQAPQTSQQGDDSGQGDKEGKKGPPESVASRDKPVCWEWDCRWPKSKHGQRTLTKLKIATKVGVGRVVGICTVDGPCARGTHVLCAYAWHYSLHVCTMHASA